jgi:hypothetical protein
VVARAFGGVEEEEAEEEDPSRSTRAAVWCRSHGCAAVWAGEALSWGRRETGGSWDRATGRRREENMKVGLGGGGGGADDGDDAGQRICFRSEAPSRPLWLVLRHPVSSRSSRAFGACDFAP